LTRALLALAVALAAAALAVALLWRSSDGHSEERARAVTDAGLILTGSSGGHPAFHVSDASRVSHNVWRVEVKQSLPRGDSRTPQYDCLTIELDRFYSRWHANRRHGFSGTVRGVSSDIGPCP
jgi:hypothetical protein